MRTIRLLTIGNSFAQNALTYLERMADASGRIRLEVGRANLGGCSLAKHWNLGVYTQAHPEFKTYRLGAAPDGTPVDANLQDALAAAPWDFVTLQQVSHQSWQRETFQPWLGQLCEMIRGAAPTAKLYLHQTWAYRSDAPFLAEKCLTQELMHARIRANYEHFSELLGCGILPSGEAVQLARRAPQRQFVWPEADYDYFNPAIAPRLPRQEHSLEVGWRWLLSNSPDGIPTMQLDPKHLNARGCYLIGCVWFACLTGIEAREIAYLPPEIDPETGAFLRACAGTAVRNGSSACP